MKLSGTLSFVLRNWRNWGWMIAHPLTFHQCLSLGMFDDPRDNSGSFADRDVAPMGSVCLGSPSLPCEHMTPHSAACSRDASCGTSSAASTASSIEDESYRQSPEQ